MGQKRIARRFFRLQGSFGNGLSLGAMSATPNKGTGHGGTQKKGTPLLARKATRPGLPAMLAKGARWGADGGDLIKAIRGNSGLSLLHEKDRRTGLFPFMLAATEELCPLTTAELVELAVELRRAKDKLRSMEKDHYDEYESYYQPHGCDWPAFKDDPACQEMLQEDKRIASMAKRIQDVHNQLGTVFELLRCDPTLVEPMEAGS